MRASSAIPSFAASTSPRAAAPSPGIRRHGRRSSLALTAACPPELIFGGHGVGELFIARDAGNLVDVGTLGTIEYGAAVLGSPLIVILAHTACGAVKAACDIVTKNATYPGVIGRMIEPIVPAALAVRNDVRRLRRQYREGEREADRRELADREQDRLRCGRRGKA